MLRDELRQASYFGMPVFIIYDIMSVSELEHAYSWL